MYSSSGAADPNILLPVTVSVSGGAFVGSGNSNARGRTQVDPRLVAGEKTAVILSIGQSTSANNCDTLYTPTNSKVENLSIHDGGIYRAVDPLLGCDRLEGNWLARLGDKFITAGTYARVILVPIALSGANANEWGSGVCHHRLVAAASRIASLGLTTTFVLYMQGESEKIDGIPKATYKVGVNNTISTLRGRGINCPFFVSTTSWTSSAASADIAAGQAELVNNPAGIYAGPNTDSLNDTYRRDTTHFNALGADAVASLWQTTLTPFA